MTTPSPAPIVSAAVTYTGTRSRAGQVACRWSWPPTMTRRHGGRAARSGAARSGIGDCHVGRLVPRPRSFERQN